MIGIVIVAHGGLAREYLAAMEHVVGKQGGTAAVSIDADDDINAASPIFREFLEDDTVTSLAGLSYRMDTRNDRVLPTGGYEVVESVEAGMAAISGYPAVIKADGLAAGKGVVIAADEAQARAPLTAMLVEKRFGDTPVVVEEFLAGDELSLLAICDGETALPLAPARDYKRIGDGDTGPNTGGMGCYSPVPEIDDAFVERMRREVHQPVVGVAGHGRDRPRQLVLGGGTPAGGLLHRRHARREGRVLRT